MQPVVLIRTKDIKESQQDCSAVNLKVDKGKIPGLLYICSETKTFFLQQAVI